MSWPSALVLPANAVPPPAAKTTRVVPAGSVVSVATWPRRSTLTIRSGSATRAVLLESQPVPSTAEASLARVRRSDPSSDTSSMVVPALVGTAATRRSPLGASAAEDAAGPRSVTLPLALMATSSPLDDGTALALGEALADGDADVVGRDDAVALLDGVVRSSAEADGDADELGAAATAVDAVAITVPSPPLSSAALSVTDARVSGLSSVTEVAGGGVGAVPNTMWMSLAASDPPADRVALRSMVTVYGVLPARWWVGVISRLLPCHDVVTWVAGRMCRPATTAAWSIGWLKATVIDVVRAHRMEVGDRRRGGHLVVLHGRPGHA